MDRFDFQLFSRTQERAPPGKYAMWWTTDEDKDLRTSPTVASIDRVYRAMDGYYSYFVGLMLNAMGTARQGETRVPLPKGEVTVVWRGPENRLYPVSVMEEKGIRFFLPVASTSVPFRESFWRLFAEYAEEKRKTFDAARLPRDPPSAEFPGGPAVWWRNAKGLFGRLGGGPEASIGNYLVRK